MIKIREKNRDLIGKKFDSEPVYGDKYIRQKESHTMILEQIFMVKVIAERYQKKIAHISVCY